MVNESFFSLSYLNALKNRKNLNGDHSQERVFSPRALISVSDKSGLTVLGRRLFELGFEIVSTGSTADALTKGQVPVRRVSEVTGFPEILGGRVKTLHPAVFGGILSRPSLNEDRYDLNEHGIAPIPIVVCNLYPFVQALQSLKNVKFSENSSSLGQSEQSVAIGELIENIDIGGVTLLRAAAKNHENVLILCDPADYDLALSKLEAGCLSLADRRAYALKALKETAAYDAIISQTLENIFVDAGTRVLQDGPILGSVKENSVKDFAQDSNLAPETIQFSLRKVSDLRYGENPHQNAALYATDSGILFNGQSSQKNSATDLNLASGLSLLHLKQLSGKELSYNNYLDTEHGLRLLADLPMGACVIVKHNMPCGVGLASVCPKPEKKTPSGEVLSDLSSPSSSAACAAFERAFSADPVSPFGGVVLFNMVVDGPAAQRLSEIFLEIVSAPGFTADALEILNRKKNLRIIEIETQGKKSASRQFTQIQGGFLVQSTDASTDVCDIFSTHALQWKSATSHALGFDELQALKLAWTVAKHVRSNAIVLASTEQTLAIAGGFTNRVDAVRRCLDLYQSNVKAADLSVKNTLPDFGFVLASDGFFPFSDSIEILREFPVRAIVQPGGSVRDEEVVKKCQDQGYPLVLTGVRHFKH